MKKAFALFLALCMMFALCACGQTEAPAQPETPAEPQTETPAEAPAETTGWAPNGPVTMIVAYKAGNGTDVTARILAQYAEKYVGQTIVIENVDGHRLVSDRRGCARRHDHRLHEPPELQLIHRKGTRHLHHRGLRRHLQPCDRDLSRPRARGRRALQRH